VKLPAYPNVFTKAPTSLTGPYADIPYDAAVTAELDWEVELAVVIGRAGRHIANADALAHVWGYTVLNDVSARDIQHKPGVQYFQGKSVDASSPVGPWIVTADEVADAQNLRLSLRINGETKQDDSTRNMLFDVATIIEALSRVLTLEPGDIIATGTPAGVGFARTPPEFLRPGDLMESEIEGIGTLRNRIVEVR
ncbi:MAG: fumarylacetoacetate hydrolase family protein, partial [Ktedonobacterales bacterium]